MVGTEAVRECLQDLKHEVYKAQEDINAIVRKLADQLPFGYEIAVICPDKQYYRVNGVEIPKIFIQVVIPG